MAENAVHLSSIKHSKPTIFELWAQDSLMTTLRPTFKILCEIANSKNINGHWLLNWHDEVFLILNSLLQYKYLCKHNASFSEAFYGLKRVPKDNSAESLSLKLKIRSLISVVGAPYILSKLKSYFDLILQQSQFNVPEQATHRFYFILKTLFLLINCTKFYHYIAYMTGTSTTHSFLDRIIGVEISHATPQQTVSWKELFQHLKNDPNKSQLLFSTIIKLATQTLEFGAFFIQFINWWQTNEVRSSISSLPIPSPPKSNQIIGDNLCPLCSQKRNAEVVLQPSGIIFCYSCIKSYLEIENKCPITNIPASLKDLIRLYED